VRNKINKQQIINNNDFSNLPNFEAEEFIKLTTNYSPVSSDDMEYFSLSFKILEEILLNDIESFFILFKFYMDQNELITQENRQHSNASYNKFSKSIN